MVIAENYFTKVGLVLTDFPFRSAKDELDGVKLLSDNITAINVYKCI